MIIRARCVLTMDGVPLDNGAVHVRGGRIEAVGAWNHIKGVESDEIVDLGERVLLPGLINAHCHLDYTCLRGRLPRQSSFTEWIRAINAEKAPLTPADYLASIGAGFREAAEYGTTTIANLEAFPELLAQMLRTPMRTWWFAEMIDVRSRLSAADVYTDLRQIFDERRDWLGGVSVAPHAPFTASPQLYSEASELAARFDLPSTTHLAESREEMKMFQDASGALFEFMESIGRPMDDCGGITPLGWALQPGLLTDRAIVAHLNELTAADLIALETAPKFHVVHCPRSHRYFGHSPFRFEEIKARGFNVCLGTDSLASNSDLSLFGEMREFAAQRAEIWPWELLEMVTTNPAAALRQQNNLGRLRAGYAADFIALDIDTSSRDPEAEVIAFEGKVPWRMVNGLVQSGS